jgi:hypothetical protein
MQDELFPPRKVKHVRPEDSVNEVLDTAAAVGWDLRAAMKRKDEPLTNMKKRNLGDGQFVAELSLRSGTLWLKDDTKGGAVELDLGARATYDLLDFLYSYRTQLHRLAHGEPPDPEPEERNPQ